MANNPYCSAEDLSSKEVSDFLFQRHQAPDRDILYYADIPLGNLTGRLVHNTGNDQYELFVLDKAGELTRVPEIMGDDAIDQSVLLSEDEVISTLQKVAGLRMNLEGLDVSSDPYQFL